MEEEIRNVCVNDALQNRLQPYIPDKCSIRKRPALELLFELPCYATMLGSDVLVEVIVVVRRGKK